MATADYHELPTITPDDSDRTALAREKQTTKRHSRSGLVACGFIVLVLGAAISGAFTLLGKNQLLAWLGAKPEIVHPDKTDIAIQELHVQFEQLSQLLSEIKQTQSALTARTDIAIQEMNTLSQRVNNIERFASDLEQRIAEHKKAQQIQVEVQKKQVARTKPKSVAIVPLVLISIRNQAGIPFVTLRDGLDQSELLMPGDSWRGWTLLYADPATKTAHFKVAGSERELRL